jgi:hypothetical protein
VWLDSATILHSGTSPGSGAFAGNAAITIAGIELGSRYEDYWVDS